MRALLLLLLPACVLSQPNPPAEAVTLTDPRVEELAVSCDVDEGTWLLQVEASSWSAAGVLTWTLDGDYLEQHTLSSVGAAADGSADALEADLTIVGDWRDAGGSSTAFFCSDRPAAVLALTNADGSATTDCVSFGADTAVLEGIEGVPADCPRVVVGAWDTGTETGDTGT